MGTPQSEQNVITQVSSGMTMTQLFYFIFGLVSQTGLRLSHDKTFNSDI